MTVKRMDNVGIVVEDLDAAIEFFIELGLVLEGRMPIEGEWSGRVTGLHGQRVEIAMMRTPDGQFIVGVIPPTNANTYVFVYEVASGIVLRNRTVAGASTVLSMSPISIAKSSKHLSRCPTISSSGSIWRAAAAAASGVSSPTV